MNSLWAILAGTTASTAFELTGRTLSAVAKPFDAMLQAAVGKAESAAAPPSVGEVDAEADAVRADLADRLQELFDSLGAAAGDAISLQVDEATGAIRVGDQHGLAAAIEEAIERDPRLGEDIRKVAALDSDGELLFQVAEESNEAIIPPFVGGVSDAEFVSSRRA